MRTIVTIIALISFSFAFANNNEKKDKKEMKRYSITGNVIDAKESLTGVKVLLDGKETTVYTDFDGNFTLEDVVQGEHTVSFSLITYKNKAVVVKANNNTSVTVELEEK
jgi:hypothetical protein